MTRKKEASGKNRSCVINFNGADPTAEPGAKLLHLYNGKQFYCKCKSGSRTGNPCAHITAVLMFMYHVKNESLAAYIHEHRPKYPEPLNCWIYDMWRHQYDSVEEIMSPGINDPEEEKDLVLEANGNHNRHVQESSDSPIEIHMDFEREEELIGIVNRYDCMFILH